jgi:hypothetical protein
MASAALHWSFRACPLIGGLLAATGIGYLASWALRQADPDRSEFLAMSASALSLGFYFSLAAVVIARLIKQPSAIGAMPSNYSLERSVTAVSERAAGARTIIAPAARRPRTRTAPC